MTPSLAVIFDVDGVLVDSYDAHLHSWRQVASESDVSFNEQDFAATFGKTSRDIVHRFWKTRGGPLDDAEVRRIDDRKEALYRELVRSEFPAMDGAAELIDALHAAGFRLAMGSSGPPENVELALERLGRRSKFSAAVTGRDVMRGKPDPEIFLTAAKRLGVEPANCAVIEDSAPGLTAARAAEMASIALLSKGHKPEDFAAANPDRIVRSLRDISPDDVRGLIDRR